MVSGKLLGIILVIWEAFGSHLGCQGSFWEPFGLSEKLLGVILAVREASEEHVGCQGSFWEPFWLSGKLLGAMLAGGGAEGLERYNASRIRAWAAGHKMLW